jgi:cytosine/adenosine deaminase-related metal-dependent hydrolase
VALPAPVDAHDHGRGLRTAAFGAADATLETWLAALPLEPKVDPYLRAAVAFARLAEGGICAANHCHNPQDPSRLVEEAQAVARAARDVGIRIAFAVPVMDRNPMVYGDLGQLAALLPADRRGLVGNRDPRFRSAEKALALVEAIAEFEHPLFSVQYCPVGPQWVEDSTLAAIAEASAKTGRRVHMHLFETERQRQWADAHYPDGLVRHFDAIGLLSPRLTIAHGVWLREDECALMAERGVVVSVNTSSNLRLRSGIAPVDRFVATGMRFGVGLDGMAFDEDEDMLREMRLMFALQRGFGGTETLDAARVFQAACVDGRRTVTSDEGGTLAPGAAADVMVLDLAAMSHDVLPGACEPLDLILTRATKRHLHRLIVAGRSIVEKGRIVTVDLPGLEAALLHEARANWHFSTERRSEIATLQNAIGRFYQCGCHRGAMVCSPAAPE